MSESTVVDHTEQQPGNSHCYRIHNVTDVKTVILACRHLARELGFPKTQAYMVATALSEMAHNILYHAGGGRVYLRPLHDGIRSGIEIEAIDQGPGIVDISLAMQDHYSTRGTLGVGLPAIKRLMHDMTLESAPGKGTHVKAQRWL